MELSSQDPHPRNNLGWILATSSDVGIRDAARAVEYAQQAVALSGGREVQFFRTLAAAYAASNRFPDAIAAAQQAAAVAGMQGKRQLAKNLEEDLLLYRAHLALRKDFSSE